jgi:xylan 1,4-beta-xylosidase
MHLSSARLALLLLASSALAAHPQTAPASTTTLTIDAAAPTTPFPHFWERTFGSGRAILSLRDSYREDLRTVKAATDFDSVRFHGIFMDEVGLYDPDRHVQQANEVAAAVRTSSPYNFSYIDQIYDGLLENHVRPFVELSFTPRQLASNPAALHAFWYKQNVSPPADYAKWDAMITAFTQHLIDRYGIDEVSHWDFEVWNEPNIDFWTGDPKQPTYFNLYDHTARAVKKASARIRVGGPATAQAAWVTAFLAHCKQDNIPVDFVSTHVYANDTAKDVFGTAEQIPRDQMVFRSVKKVHDEIAASPLPKTPLIFSEYNASYANEPDVTDTVYMGPWIANTIRLCDGLTESMAYWAFSDVFEEQGVVRTPFYGGFGLIAADHIRKPSFNAFAMLHHLGTERLALSSDSALATRAPDGSLVIALWNYAPPFGTGSAYTPPPPTLPPSRTFTLTIRNTVPSATVQILRVDADHGDVLKLYDSMGRPDDPTRKQIAQLRSAGQPAPPENTSLHSGILTLDVPAQGLAVITIHNAQLPR